MIVRLRTASRLHFGLLRIPGKDASAARERSFGGVGLMIEKPGIDLTVFPGDTWHAAGPGADRALAFLHKVSESLGEEEQTPAEICLAQCAPEHQGLGTGTQLGLAIALALNVLKGHHQRGAAELARLAGRGERSAVGLHGFDQGGFLVEAGKRADEALAPLVARLDFPPEWRIVLALPPTKAGLHGCEERGAFERLRHNHADESRTDRLCRLVLLGLIPALMNRDYEAFGEALYEFNRRAGEPFTEVQGGVYRHRQIAEMIEFLRRKGALGAGQSSWGPAVFGIVPDVGQADLLARRLQDDFSLSEREVLVTSACNQGATCIAKG